MTDEALLKMVVSALGEKKAEDVVVLDLRKVSTFTDYFVIASGQNQKQLLAMADAVQEKLRSHSLRPIHVEGYPRQEWILLDYSIFVVHAFTQKTRTFYDLERLWGAAVKMEMAR